MYFGCNLTIPVKTSLAARYHHHHQQVRQQHELLERFLGFNLKQTSHDNLRMMRALLSQGDEGINQTLVSTAANQPNVMPYLTANEQRIFEILLSSFTLKHATGAINAIKADGKMQSLRLREAQDQVTDNRHTPNDLGADYSLYFAMGIGHHDVSTFISHAADIITV